MPVLIAGEQIRWWEGKKTRKTYHVFSPSQRPLFIPEPEVSMTRLSHTVRMTLCGAAAAISWLLATISYLLANAR